MTLPAISEEAERILAALDEGSRGWPHNEFLTTYDTFVSEAVRRAEAGAPTADEDLTGQQGPLARLVPANSKYVPMVLAEWLVQPLKPLCGEPCDRCSLSPSEPRLAANLLVPAGATVVMLSVCANCVHELDERYNRAVIWS
jgi:hypothetical protein